ncbi:vomeronasal type-2 receptor 1-like [Genypterus blacodes]|uniref:vomeronasal type-2 receptor 1-like n=1 Tax=Genypterus blacodes TaxID=154954 RepID=UPI003F767DAB
MRAFRWTQVMIFAIEEINRDATLLPNISLGYKILNSCSSPPNTLRAALTLASGTEEKESTSSCPPAISALIAESGSSQSIAVAGTLGSFQVPVVSYFSTCACLSDKSKYPTFFRTIPSDYYQAKALAALVKHFGWQWIGAIQSDSDYGRQGILAFTKEVKKLEVCIAFVGTVYRTYKLEKYLDVVKMIKQSTVKVILAFGSKTDIYPLMKEVVKQNITGIQWIGSEAWITAARLSTPETYRSFGGTIGTVVQKMAMPKLKPFLTNISHYSDLGTAFVGDFWEVLTGCKTTLLGKVSRNQTKKKLCKASELLLNTKDAFFDISELRVTYNVYKAVYAVAHALHHLVFCEPAGVKAVRPCLNLSEIQPKQVSDHLHKVNFKNDYGDTVFFDEKGDPPASYDIINWQLIDGQVQHVILGHFSSTANKDYELSIKEENIVWRTGTVVPKSVCSNMCPVGTRKAPIKGKPICCFDCFPCADGTIANSTGSADCTPCPQEYWSNEKRDKCILKTIEFLSYHEPMGIAITVVSLLGALLSLSTMFVFIRYKETPVIKASNSELSCFLLFSLFTCFLCPLTFIGRPTVWTCMLRHTAFGVTFALCISCVLGKTVVVVTAFKATIPGNKVAGKFGPAQQRIIVGSCTFIQIVICVLWLTLNPPFPDMVFRYSSTKIVLECNTGSEAAFYAVLGYIGLLAIVCLVLAFLARKLPDNFNEAKFITFSMLIFCAVWITFIPAYVSSPGKFTVAVEIFAILSSAFGLLLSVFAPKCYIILIKPERNTKKHVMGIMCLNTAFGCELFGRFNMPSLFKQGDLMIGGIFPVFNKDISSTSSFKREPPGAECTGFYMRAFRWTQVMIFAIEEINRDATLLPNISLGYKILNSCSSPPNTLRAALTLASGTEEKESTSLCPPAISALIAESGSSQSIAVAGTLGSFQVPVVSYFSTCACLSDKSKYPTFFRTIPSDYYQAKALAALVKHFGWQWIGAIQSDSDYGRQGILAFTKEVKKLGVCIAFVGTVYRTYKREKYLDVVKMIKQSTVKVILAFIPKTDIYPLMKEVVKQNITGIQWIGSEAWITAASLSTPETYRSFGGTIGTVVQKMAMPKLKPFLTNISHYSDLGTAFVGDFWEVLTGCKPPLLGKVSRNQTKKKLCKASELLLNTKDAFFDISELRVTYNVYKAVYAVAHALHHLVFCEPAGVKAVRPCLNLSEIQPKQVSHHLHKVNFKNDYGDTVFFDEKGDPPASYDIINWQLIDGQVQHVILGHFSSTANKDYELSIKEENIVWRTGTVVPKSVCSNMCPVGTRKAPIKGKPICCFDCFPCADGTIANSTGSADCTPCPQEYWSNEKRDKCILKTIEFLSYHEPMGIAITVVSLLGALLSLSTMFVFIRYKETPVIKASNSELSCFLLFSLFTCFLCPLTFIGRPTVWTCMLRHTAFGVTFALCISCVLGKTIVVVTAFKATIPGNKVAGKFGPAQQRIIVGSCTFIQIVICVLWLTLNPPFPDMVFRYSSTKIVSECNTGSEAAFYAVLGYIGLLAIVCLVLAFLARKLPDNFNEAKFITFSMLIFCAVWITFIPAYVSSPGKFTVAVEIFAILSSAFGLLLSVFAPKCYIILIKPERNTKKHVMGKEF